MAAPMILPVSAGPERPAQPLPERLRAYRLSLPSLDKLLVLVVDEDGDPVGWTSQAEPFDSAPAMASLYRKLSRLTYGSVVVSDIEFLSSGGNTASASEPDAVSARWGVLGQRQQIRVLEGGRR